MVFNVPGVGVRSVVQVQLGQGDGTFRRADPRGGPARNRRSRSGSIYYGMRVVFGSFTGDASLDLAATHVGSAAIFIFEGNGDGTFDPPTQVPLTFYPSSLRAGDLNGDGTDDFVAGWAWGTPGPAAAAGGPDLDDPRRLVHPGDRPRGDDRRHHRRRCRRWRRQRPGRRS
ncbi:MAG: VCBS repeat-containing protein [Acidimicrobiales bacterium]